MPYLRGNGRSGRNLSVRLGAVCARSICGALHGTLLADWVGAWLVPLLHPIDSIAQPVHGSIYRRNGAATIRRSCNSSTWSLSTTSFLLTVADVRLRVDCVGFGLRLFPLVDCGRQLRDEVHCKRVDDRHCLAYLEMTNLVVGEKMHWTCCRFRQMHRCSPAPSTADRPSFWGSDSWAAPPDWDLWPGRVQRICWEGEGAEPEERRPTWRRPRRVVGEWTKWREGAAPVEVALCRDWRQSVGSSPGRRHSTPARLCAKTHSAAVAAAPNVMTSCNFRDHYIIPSPHFRHCAPFSQTPRVVLESAFHPRCSAMNWLRNGDSADGSFIETPFGSHVCDRVESVMTFTQHRSINAFQFKAMLILDGRRRCCHCWEFSNCIYSNSSYLNCGWSELWCCWICSSCSIPGAEWLWVRNCCWPGWCACGSWYTASEKNVDPRQLSS